jgi:hypothetical protein
MNENVTSATALIAPEMLTPRRNRRTLPAMRVMISRISSPRWRSKRRRIFTSKSRTSYSPRPV